MTRNGWVQMSGTEIVLDPDPPAPGMARRWLRGELSRLGRADLSDTAELLVTEVVTNAVLHAGTPIRVTVREKAPGVRVDVRDGSTTEPVRRQHHSLVALGRGLALLENLASDWGWNLERNGKVVWFVVQPGRTPEGTPAELGSASTPGPAETAESGLGRYVEDATGPTVRVRLLGLPVLLLVASQDHHDALIRELRLIALAAGPHAPAPAAGLGELIEELGVRHARARGRRDREIQAAIDGGLLQIDQEFGVPVNAGEEMRRVVTLLGEADRYCDENLLLTLSRPPLVRRFTAWYLDEIIGQIAGRPPRPWIGPLTLDGDER